MVEFLLWLRSMDWGGFLSNALRVLVGAWGGILSSAVGVLLGAYLSWRLLKWQMNKERVDKELRDKELLLLYLDRLKVDLRENAQWANVLADVVAESERGRVDLFHYVSIVADALSSQLYQDFRSTGLSQYLTTGQAEALHSAYGMIEGLRAMAKQAEPAAEFYFGYSASEDKVNRLHDNLRSYAGTVYGHLAFVRDEYYKLATSLRQELGYARVPEARDPGVSG